MKKTYIIPRITDEVKYSMTLNILVSSADLHSDGNGNLVGGLTDRNATGEGLAKENKSVWDEEW